jgi:hypothetical protein
MRQLTDIAKENDDTGILGFLFVSKAVWNPAD